MTSRVKNALSLHSPKVMGFAKACLSKADEAIVQTLDHLQLVEQFAIRVHQERPIRRESGAGLIRVHAVID